MKPNRWDVVDMEQDETRTGSHDIEEESSGNDTRPKQDTVKPKFRRLEVFSARVQKRVSEATALLSKLQQGEECSEDDEILIDQLQQAIDTFVSEIKDLYRDDTSRTFIEERDYTSTQMEAEDLLVAVKRRYTNSMEKKTAQSPVHSNTTSRLPKIELPKFDGNKLKWYEFWGRFKSSIDSRRDLPDIDKLDYLLGLMEGEAKEAIQGLDITEENYTVAIGILNDSFGKPDLIIDAHYEALDNIIPARDDPKDCRKVLNQVERHLKVLHTLGEDVNKNNQIRHMLPKKFPQSLRFDLNMVMRNQDNTVQNLRKALSDIITAKETVTAPTRRQEPIQPKNSFTTEALVANNSSQKRHAPCEDADPSSTPYQKRKGESTQNFSQRKPWGQAANKKRRYQCIFCEGDHYPDQCNKFPTAKDRIHKIGNRCQNCLGVGHIVPDCPRLSKTCFYCKKPRHHRSLCFQRFGTGSQEDKRDNTQKTMSTLTYSQSETVLQTALANIRNSESGDMAMYRILFDTGSQRSYVTNKVVEQLKLTAIEENSLTVYTFGRPNPRTIDSKLVNIHVETPNEAAIPITAYVVPTITGAIPSFNSLKGDIKQTYSKIVMAEDDNRESNAEILIGNDHYHSFFSGAREHIKDNLYLLESKLGWILSGCQFQPDNSDVLSMVTYVQTGRCRTKDQVFTLPDPPLQDDLIKVIWELESIGIRDSPKVLEGDEIIKFFNDTTVFEDGRYQVKWPWIQYPTDLPINYGMALGRLGGLIKRSDQDTLMTYDQVLKDQLEKGIIEVVDGTKFPEGHAVHYLPHHGVSQPHKTTKLRIVYDASAKFKGKCSLNEYLFKGPLMLEDLLSLLITFRSNKIGITADIEKAFLQVGLQKDDRDVTRFLWVKDINKSVTEENIVHMRFCRVPFGIISSPYLLAATIRHHLTKKHLAVADNVAKCLYVDNLISGASSVETGYELYRTAVDAFSELSMNIRDWVTNSSELRERILPQHRCETSDISLLGLRWNTDADTLSLMVDPKIFERNVSSKREILKIIASIYDPCGFIAPLTLAARIFLQMLWTEQYKWDTPLPDEKITEWKTCVSPLRFIPEVEIPRYYFDELTHNQDLTDTVITEIHCFTDASKDAYCAVIYIRKVSKDNIISVNLVMSRTRLTPVRSRGQMTTPKLELLGVLIGSRLLIYVNQVFKLDSTNLHLWSDSQVVLGWLQSDKLLQPFVGRRINEIRSYRGIQFHYICSQDNPADLATKPPSSTLPYLWYHGPGLLHTPDKDWPQTTGIIHALDCVSTTTEPHQDGTAEDIEYEVQDAAIESNATDDNNSTRTLRNNNDAILKIQQESFPREIRGEKTALQKSLNLFIDREGLLRCTGRLQNAVLPYDQKFPILLPTNNTLTSDIIRDCHVRNHHVGANHTLTLLRKKYWIPQGKRQVKKILNKCTQCIKYGGGPYKLPPMPPLPKERVELCRPFMYTGLDYLGPLTAVDGDTMVKRWCCIFTCMASRAIHLEIVNNSSANEFLLCLRRFVAMRGIPTCIVSDNALQFKLTAEVVQAPFCQENTITWHFIPELTPWQGGFYERLVGLVKHCLRRTLDKILLTSNQLSTVIKEIEAVLNSRPLTAVDDSLDHILTPSDFLLSCRTHLIGPPADDAPAVVTATKSDLVAGWKQGQKALEEFRSIFKDQYLTSLRERAVVPHHQPRVLAKTGPKIGDLVQIWDDRSKSTNRAHWKVGRIESFIPSTDGEVRTARVKLDPGGVVTRSIAHLYPLELNCDETLPDEEPSPETEAHDIDASDTDFSPPASSGSRMVSPDVGPSGGPSRDNVVSDLPELSASPSPSLGRPVRRSATAARRLIRQWTQSLLSLHPHPLED